MRASSTKSLLNEALGHLAAALELLDRTGAPGDIGARVDHARQRIEEMLSGVAGSGARQAGTPWQ